MGSRWKVLWVVLMLVILSEATTSGSSEGKKKAADKVDDDLLDDDEATVHDDDVVTMKLDDYEIEYKTPVPSDSKSVYLSETFDSVALAKTKWTPSQATKSSSDSVFKYSGVWDFDLPERRIFPNDRALILRSKAAHAAISAPLSRPFEFTTKPLVVQYEVTFQNGMDCGGAYIKLLSQASKEPLNLAGFHDKTPYTIMFGPDKCGSDIKLHFIFRHKHPLNGSYSEKHAKRPSNRLEETFSDKKPHLYKLILRPTNRFEVYVDGSLINSGTLLEDMEPPVNPSMEIEDPNDSKPEDWDEREKIPDKNAAKPADWNEDEPPKIPDPDAKVPSGWLEDEPESIPDPNAVQPEDWDESMDGTWEPPLISNPACEEAVGCGPWTPPLVENPNFKGRWNPPLVDNPNYRGKWTRRMIPNPDYFEDKEPFKMTPIGAVGLEIWTMTENVLWDNFIVADNPEVVDKWTEETYQVKIRALERDSRGVVERIINYSNKHPWLYAVYTLVIGLPVVLIIAFWCGGNDKKSVGAEMPNEIQEEDEDEPEEVAKQEEVIAPQAKKNGAVSKDDLEKDDEVSQGEDGEQEEEDDEGWVQTNKEEGDENDEQGEDEEEAEDDEKDDEVVDEVIEDKPESRENSQLKKRRTRRD